MRRLSLFFGNHSIVGSIVWLAWSTHYHLPKMSKKIVNQKGKKRIFLWWPKFFPAIPNKEGA
jgi:hypothetical protein